jgi:hypothetical protein
VDTDEIVPRSKPAPKGDEAIFEHHRWTEKMLLGMSLNIRVDRQRLMALSSKLFTREVCLCARMKGACESVGDLHRGHVQCLGTVKRFHAGASFEGRDNVEPAPKAFD